MLRKHNINSNVLHTHTHTHTRGEGGRYLILIFALLIAVVAMAKIIQLKDSQGDNIYPIISEHGENANGKWLKYKDGTMICSRTITINNVNVNVANDMGGGLYRSGSISFGDFPQSFIATPDVVKSGMINYLGNNWGWFSDTGEETKTNAGRCIFVSGASSTGRIVTLKYVAIGRWRV